MAALGANDVTQLLLAWGDGNAATGTAECRKRLGESGGTGLQG